MNSRESVQTAKLPNLQSLQDQALDTARAVTDAGYAEGIAAKLDQSVLDEINAKRDAAHMRAIANATPGDGEHLKAIAAAHERAASASVTSGAPARKRGKPGLKPGAGRKPSSGHYYTESLAVQIIRLVEQTTPIADYVAAGQVRPGIGSLVGVPPNIIQMWLRNEGSVRKGDEHLRVEGKFLVEGREFAQSFARAREIAADNLADEMLALARHLSSHPQDANAVRVQADILRWQAVTRYRTRYGEPEASNKPAPQVLISIGSHSPAAPKLVGASSVAAQIEHSQPRSVVNTPGKSATRVIGPTDTGSVSRGGVTIQAQVTGATQAGQGPRSGEGAPLGA